VRTCLSILLITTGFFIAPRDSPGSGTGLVDPDQVIPHRNHEIGYINKEIPPLSMRVWEGERYPAMVPDTLDLAERAKLAIHGVTNILDPEYDYEMFWLAEFNRIPPVLIHQTLWAPWLDGENYKIMESLPLLRLVTGGHLNLEVDKRWRERTLQQIGPDGLAYWPAKGRPWVELDTPPDGWDPALGDTSLGQICGLGMTGRLIATLTLYSIQDQDPVWRRTAEKMIDRVAELAVDKGDYAYLPKAAIAPGAGATDSMPMPDKPGEWSYHVAWLVQGLAQYYRTYQYVPARDLALKLARYLMGPSGNFKPDGTFSGMDHFHMNTSATMAIVDLASATGDKKLEEFGRKAFEYGRSIGDPLVGFFPEGLRYLKEDGSYEFKYRGVETAETCEVSDMIVCGLKLAGMGHDEYWDDVDRWIRNQFIENQLTRVDWIYRFLERESRPDLDQEIFVREKGKGRPLFQGRPMPMTVEVPYDNGDRAAERNIGCFAGWPSANDFAIWEPEKHAHLGMMHCCTGNGTRAIYYAWQSILDFKDETLRINLLLNRTSPWADVSSHVPYTGQLDVRVKKACRLEIRIPEWVQPGQVTCSVDDRRRSLHFSGRYAQVGEVGSGDLVIVNFPIHEKSMNTRIGGVSYDVVVKGSTVVYINPPGRLNPYYQRAHYRENNTRWVERDRFVSDVQLQW
jgi:hypothetical protein